MCKKDDSTTGKPQPEVRCPWCGMGTLHVHYVPFPKEEGVEGGFNQVDCSECMARVQVGVNEERAMLPFVALYQMLDSLQDLEKLSTAVQSALREFGDSYQTEPKNG
jgi:ribosomal protein S27E